jgi:hypothetical protein
MILFIKRLIIVLSVLIAIAAIIFWNICIKSEVVTNRNFISLASIDNQLKVETAESAKYISEIEYTTTMDTVILKIRTTTVFNPFAKKETFRIIPLSDTIRFIKIGDVVLLRSKFVDKERFNRS